VRAEIFSALDEQVSLAGVVRFGPSGSDTKRVRGLCWYWIGGRGGGGGYRYQYPLHLLPRAVVSDSPPPPPPAAPLAGKDPPLLHIP
jgi:hypothetical protein